MLLLGFFRRLAATTPPWMLWLLVIVGLAAPLVVYLFDVSAIHGTSMAPTLVGPGFGFYRPIQREQIRRGDIVPFNTDEKYFLKRVIGLPGETITIAGGSVYVQPAGQSQLSVFREPYLAPGTRTYSSTVVEDGRASQYLVPAGSLFVLADQRGSGGDSRSFQQDRYLDSPFVPVSSVRSRLVAFIGVSGIRRFTSPSTIQLQPYPAALVPFCPKSYPCKFGQRSPKELPESVE